MADGLEAFNPAYLEEVRGLAVYHTIFGHIAEPAEGILHVRRGHGCMGTWQAYDV